MEHTATLNQASKRNRTKMVVFSLRITPATNKRLRKVTGRKKGQTDMRTYIETALVEKLDREKGAAA